MIGIRRNQRHFRLARCQRARLVEDDVCCASDPLERFGIRSTRGSSSRGAVAGTLALLRALLAKETAMEYIETVLRYVLNTVENMSAEEVKSMVEQSLSAEKGELVMALAERLRNEGRQQGLQQGIVEGIQQGIVEGLLEAIELGLGIKFGPQGMKLMPAIRRIQDAERLHAIKEAVKIAKHISEVKEVIAE